MKNLTATEIKEIEKQCSKDLADRINKILEPQYLDTLEWVLKFMKDYERKHKISPRYS